MDDTQVKAVKYLIKQAPAGEIQDVLQHLHTLIGSPELLNQSDQIMKALKTWKTQRRIVSKFIKRLDEYLYQLFGVAMALHIL